MNPKGVAVVARANDSRSHIARYLRDGGYDVFECEDLAIPTQFAGIVMVDDLDPSDATRARVRSWLRLRRSPRVVIISTKPAGWKAIALAHSDQLRVLAAPAFSWDLLDALRAAHPSSPGA